MEFVVREHFHTMLRGKWFPRKKLWELPYHDVKTLGLEHRIIYDKKQ